MLIIQIKNKKTADEENAKIYDYDENNLIYAILKINVFFAIQSRIKLSDCSLWPLSCIMFEDTLHKSESVRSSALYHKLKRNTLLKLNDPKFVYDLQVANVSSESHGWLQTLIDSTHVITFVVSIVVIIYGSFKSLNIDSNNQLLAANENKSQASSLDKKNPDSNESQLQQTQNIDSTHALLIPVAASISLLLMFFFFESIQTIFLVCTCSKYL